MPEWEFDFDPCKNDLLRKERSISFEEIIALIEGGRLLRVLRHPDDVRYPNQSILEVDVDGYVYLVPAVRNKNRWFLKTIFPSRKATRFRQKGGDSE